LHKAYSILHLWGAKMKDKKIQTTVKMSEMKKDEVTALFGTLQSFIDYCAENAREINDMKIKKFYEGQKQLNAE